MKPINGIIAVSIVWSLAGLVALQAVEPAGRQIRPYVVLTGADSHVAERKCYRITSTDEWTRIWQAHIGHEETSNVFYDPRTHPVVDFDQCMVIAVFRGEGVNNAGLATFSMEEGDGHILFRFQDKSYQTLEILGTSGSEAKRVTVFGFFVVPRSKKRIIVEEDVQTSIGRPPIWKEFAEFPALTDQAQGSAKSQKNDTQKPGSR